MEPSSPPETVARSLSRQTIASSLPALQTTPGPVDIPGAATSSSPYAFEGGSTAGDSTDGPFFSGSSLSYGASPGHGMGYLMRSRHTQQGNNRRLSRQESREVFLQHLHSHDELGELADTAENDVEQGIGDVGSPMLADDSKTFALTQEDLTAPLLPRQHQQHQQPSSSSQLPNSAAAAAAVQCDATGATKQQQTVRAIVFGLINATAGIPALVAYAAIVFRHPIYAPYVDLLCKFFFLSSALHQSVFCLMSSLPFAMGQVQDVGIIFLSAMGTSIATLTLEAGRDGATALGTALLTMSASTFFVGLGTLFVARRSLAQFVQYIPLPVMGGYLAFVGYFCMASGVGLGVSVEISGLGSWSGLFERLPLLKFIPTVLSCAAMVVTLERARHPLALPTVLLSLVAIFHVVLAVAGVSLKQAQESGWVMPPAAESVQFWKLWELFHLQDWSLSGIYLPAIWRQVAKACGLLLVVVFGSCMDIAAIQQDVPFKIDFNRELTTVAVSNMIAGASGAGYTGSYIFSQTVFTMRAGVNSRINGWIIAGAEFFVFALPVSLVQYLPNYFLGALLLWFGVEISRDWLFLSFFKLTLVEYGLLWLTFCSIMQWGLEGGIAAGIVFATLFFAYAYAQSQVLNLRAGRARSSVVRTVEHLGALDLLWDSHAATAQLQGFVFFGSAQSIGAKLHEVVVRLAGPEESVREEDKRLEDAIQHSLHSMGEDYSGAKHEQALAALAVAPKFLVIDLSKVTGMDSSGARTIAETVRDSVLTYGVTPIIAGAGHHGMHALLQVNDIKLRDMRWPPELHPLLVPSRPGASPLDEAARDWLPVDGMEGIGGGGTTINGNGTPTVGNNNNTSNNNNNYATDPRIATSRSPFAVGEGSISIEGYSAEGDDSDGGEGSSSSSSSSSDVQVFSFPTLEEGLRFCEDALLEVAVQFGLCTPPGAGTTLKDCLLSHLEKLPLTSPNNAEAMAATLRRYMSHRTVRRGEVLWQVDDPAHELFLVERGVIRVDQFMRVKTTASHIDGVERLHEGATRVVHTDNMESIRVRSFELGPGCVAGSTDFYLARPHSTMAVCASVASRVLRLSRSAMARMAAEAPAALNVLQMAIMRANSSDLSAAADAAARVQ